MTDPECEKCKGTGFYQTFNEEQYLINHECECQTPALQQERKEKMKTKKAILIELYLNWWRLLTILPLVIVWFITALIEWISGKRIRVADWCLNGIIALCKGAK